MLNKGKILWCIWAGILVLLFLMSSTDLIIKEKKIEVYPISVIIEGDNDERVWTRLQPSSMGMSALSHFMLPMTRRSRWSW